MSHIFYFFICFILLYLHCLIYYLLYSSPSPLSISIFFILSPTASLISLFFIHLSYLHFIVHLHLLYQFQFPLSSYLPSFPLLIIISMNYLFISLVHLSPSPSLYLHLLYQSLFTFICLFISNYSTDFNALYSPISPDFPLIFIPCSSLLPSPILTLIPFILLHIFISSANHYLL